MSSLSSKIYLILLTKYFVTIHCTEEYGTCDQTFHIFKNTQASSDSERECKHGFNIFPYIHDEGANKFIDGMCAYQCKLQLPDTCFSIHAPQTTQHDEGLLAVDILEKKMTRKWQHVLDDTYPYDYDAFFDFNMGFWVQSLDDYILHWDKFKDDSLDKLEYFGIEWTADIDSKNLKFYSILIHSPFSAINYEFMSQHKPSLDLYDGIKWITSDIPRCTFKGMNDPYPWDRSDQASIVPVRLSHAVSDVEIIYDFYINVMGATFLSDSHQFETDIDSQKVETFAVVLLNTAIELQFIKRPQEHTYGDFTVDLYEDLLTETHKSIITSPYCGNDRWFDNHYGYSAFSIDGYMDNMIWNLNTRDMVYRVYKLPYEHSSVYMKNELDQYGYSTQYGAIVFDPSGQAIEVNGYIYDPTLEQFAPVANPQWCTSPCSGYMVQGFVDPSHVYTDDHDDVEVEIDSDIIIIDEMDIKDHSRQDVMAVIQIIVIVVGLIFAIACIASFVYCCWNRGYCCRKRRRFPYKSRVFLESDNEITPLM